ncbi:glycine--tRNA ligase [bacterium]|nr:glycine--tRNA ligase [bacterium]
MQKISALAKQRGFIFQSSEIYGGLSSSYDYGPLGVELKNNIKRRWWKSMVQGRGDIVGLDSAIFTHPKVWEASGHLSSFTDPLVDCKKCKRRFRADHLLEAKGIKPELGTLKELPPEVGGCPECGGQLTAARDFNLMFKTMMGPVEDEATEIFLRPETAQGIYVNFNNVLQSTRRRLPFGIAQIGKSFRNEITPGNFTYRTREFEQMEMQYFVKADEADKWFNQWQGDRMDWYKDLGFNESNLRFREHGKDELAHYAKKAVDVDYKYPWGWGELEGIHNRGDWDLSQHAKHSGEDLQYRDPESGEKSIPWIVETAAGADRLTLVALLDAYSEIEGGRSTTTESNKEAETVLKFHPSIAPIKVAVLPLSKKEELNKFTDTVLDQLRPKWMTMYDESGSIGKRYRRQDEIGTPFCVTVDFDTAKDKAVTVRDRDSMKQERIGISEVENYFAEKLEGI